MEALGRLSRHYTVSQGIPKSIFKTHVTIAIFLYYTLTFIHTALKVKTSGYRWMEGGGLLRDQVGKGGRHRFRISNFYIQISNFGICISSFSLIEILLTNQEVRNKKWSKTEGIFHTQ